MKNLNTTIEPPTMYETENDMPKERRSEINALLNQRLASAVDLQTQNETGALECERTQFHRLA